MTEEERRADNGGRMPGGGRPKVKGVKVGRCEGGRRILDFGCWAHGESRTFRGARVKEAHSTA